MSVDVKKLLDELGATGDDRAAVEKFFSNPTTHAKVSDWYENGLRQADYSRKMDGLRATETAKLSHLESEEKRLKETFDGLNSQFLKAQQERETAETRAATMAAQVKTLAAEWNIPETEVKRILDIAPTSSAATIPPPPATTTATPDPSQFVPRKEFDQLRDVALKLPMFAAAFPAMRDRHRELFGSVPMDFETKILEEARKQERPLAEVWDNLYGVRQKESEVNDARIRADERSKADAEWKAKMSSSAVNPMTRITAPASPIFSLEPLNKNRSSVRTAGEVDNDVARASQRFSERWNKRQEESAHQEA